MRASFSFQFISQALYECVLQSRLPLVSSRLSFFFSSMKFPFHSCHSSIEFRMLFYIISFIFVPKCTWCNFLYSFTLEFNWSRSIDVLLDFVPFGNIYSPLSFFTFTMCELIAMTFYWLYTIPSTLYEAQSGNSIATLRN